MAVMSMDVLLRGILALGIVNIVLNLKANPFPITWNEIHLFPFSTRAALILTIGWTGTGPRA
jgi:hypothetical protein